ncbi:hypothetical protein [Mangrovactinospora gilvigrisea]|uniref:hypothetical protein n=1 Tax=Mangrovactinospora gilvigrisea TaxID=1428644 RepID=UPI001587F5CC|nr:hypothetical protein [Mangrovactinospora gilvigrisea]
MAAAGAQIVQGVVSGSQAPFALLVDVVSCLSSRRMGTTIGVLGMAAPGVEVND